jgi:hypothetical protein
MGEVVAAEVRGGRSGSLRCVEVFGFGPSNVVKGGGRGWKTGLFATGEVLAGRGAIGAAKVLGSLWFRSECRSI